VPDDEKMELEEWITIVDKNIDTLALDMGELEKKVDGLSNGCSLAQQNLSDINSLQGDWKNCNSYIDVLQKEISELRKVLRELIQKVDLKGWNKNFALIEKLDGEKEISGQNTPIR